MFIETRSSTQLSPVGAKCLSPKNCPNYNKNNKTHSERRARGPRPYKLFFVKGTVST